jgi:hypothetical protein
VSSAPPQGGAKEKSDGSDSVVHGKRCPRRNRPSIEAHALLSRSGFLKIEIRRMNMGLILLVVLIILAFGGLPRWGYHRYGYAPSGVFGFIVVILVILLLMGRL